MLPLKLLDKREAPQQREKKKNFFPFSRNFSSDIYISLSPFFLPNWATISTPPLFLSRDEIWKRGKGGYFVEASRLREYTGRVLRGRWQRVGERNESRGTRSIMHYRLEADSR